LCLIVRWFPGSLLHKTFQELKNQGHKVSKDQLYNYQDWCEEIYLLFQLPQYHESLEKQQSGSKKIYGLDTGLINSTSFKTSQDLGRLMENVVFLELKRQEKEIFFNKEGKECDFLIKEKEKVIEAIQATVSLEDEKTRKREISGLQHTMKKYDLPVGTILTINEESAAITEGKNIQVLPLWRWLISY